MKTRLAYPFNARFTHITQTGKRGYPVVACSASGLDFDLRFTSWAEVKELANTLRGIHDSHVRSRKKKKP